MAKMKVIGSREAKAISEELQNSIDSIVEQCEAAGVKVSSKNITDDVSYIAQLGLASEGVAGNGKKNSISKQTGAVLVFSGKMNVVGIEADVTLLYYSGPRQTIIHSDDFNTSTNRELYMLDQLAGILGKSPFLTSGSIDSEGTGKCILGSQPGVPVKAFLSGLAGYTKLASVLKKQADDYFKASEKYVKYMNIVE